MYPTEYLDLLPDPESLNSWQKCVRDAIIWMQQHRLPYHWPKDNQPNHHQGCIADMHHQGSLIMKAGDPPGAYCCGATMECFMRAWSNFMVGAEDQDISAAQMKELYKYFFVWASDDNRYDEGAKAGLLWLAKQCDWLTVQATEDADELPFGAFLQMQFGPNAVNQGHSVVVIGHGHIEDEKCLIVWSANYGYGHTIEKVGDSYKVEKSVPFPSGHGFDYYYKTMVKDGFTRLFHGAWIVSE